MLDDLISHSCQVYTRLSDDLSRYVYKTRLLYNFTTDPAHLRKLVNTAPHGKIFIDKLYQAVKRKNTICIFGSGVWGQYIKRYYTDIKFECFIDNNKRLNGKWVDDIPIISFEEWLKYYRDSTVIISSKAYFKEIFNQLISHGIKEEKIINAGKYIYLDSLKQYFDLPEIRQHRENEEVFLDGGAFDGWSSLMFAKWVKRVPSATQKIFAFEPDTINRKKFCETLSLVGLKYKIFDVGLWNRRDTINFAANLNGGSHIVKTGQTAQSLHSIKVDKIDNLITEKVTFLKMDIEGAELEALEGAQKLIKTYRPKLAICVYHRPEDILTIPELILEFVPEYRFWLRHYSLSSPDTVLYGVC